MKLQLRIHHTGPARDRIVPIAKPKADKPKPKRTKRMGRR